MKKQSFLSRLYIFIILAFMQLPILILIVSSFNSSTSRAVWGGFSFKWYGEMFSDPTVMGALWVTLGCGFLAALISTIIGTLAAIGLNSMKKKAYAITLGISYLPMMNAEIVTGVSLFLLYSICGVETGFVTLLISHITFCLPYVILSVMPKVRQFEYSRYEAAIDLGATPAYAIYRIMLPELAPGIISGFIISLTLSIDDFVISNFTSGGGVENLSMLIFSSKSSMAGTSQKINALSAIMYAAVLAILILNNVRNSKSNKEKLF